MQWVEWVSNVLTAHQRIIGHSVPQQVGGTVFHSIIAVYHSIIWTHSLHHLVFAALKHLQSIQCLWIPHNRWMWNPLKHQLMLLRKWYFTICTITADESKTNVVCNITINRCHWWHAFPSAATATAATTAEGIRASLEQYTEEIHVPNRSTYG